MNEHIRALQAGLGLQDDGVLGPITREAIIRAAEQGRLSIARASEAKPLINPPANDDIPEAGQARLAGVHEALVGVVREASQRCAIPFTVIEGLRTAERQRQLVAAGASKTQNSRHLTGHAVDLWPLNSETGKPLPSDAAFPKGSKAGKDASARLWADLRAIAAIVKQVAKERGVQIEWGGDWGWDAPHFQLNRAAYPA